MTRQLSSIHRLPDDIREQFNAWLRQGRFTQIQITAMTNAALEDAGENQRVSKSAVNRYASRMNEAGKALRQAREVSEQWIAKLGSVPEGDIGRLNIEFVRTLSFELQLLMRERKVNQDSLPQTIDLARKLATLARNIEEAARMNVVSEMDVRKAERDRMREKLDELAATDGPELDADTLKRVRAIYGIE